jgi:hypothetical protein
MPNLKEPFDDPNTNLSRSLKQIKFFSLGGYCDRLSISLLCPYLQSLEVLELVDLHDLKVR